jgi:hypothetical protein
MSEQNPAAEAVREPLLNPVDRITEFLFGLLMALSFVGAVSVAETGAEEIHELFVAAVGCNLAWGLVDGVMYIIRTITDRGRTLTLLRSVREAPDAATGRGHIDRSLSKVAAGLLSAAEVEAARLRILALPAVPARPGLRWSDLFAALAVFAIVVVSTFPVVLPFAFMEDVALAKNTSRAIALALLFFGGLALGRYAGYSSWKLGFMMVGIGTVLVWAILVLGG